MTDAFRMALTARQALDVSAGAIVPCQARAVAVAAAPSGDTSWERGT